MASAAVKLEACVGGESAFTLVLDDPAGNSYIETPAESHDKDPLLRLEHYERTPEQAEGVGLLPPEPAGRLSWHQPCSLECEWRISFRQSLCMLCCMSKAFRHALHLPLPARGTCNTSPLQAVGFHWLGWI